MLTVPTIAFLATAHLFSGAVYFSICYKMWRSFTRDGRGNSIDHKLTISSCYLLIEEEEGTSPYIAYSSERRYFEQRPHKTVTQNNNRPPILKLLLPETPSPSGSVRVYLGMEQKRPRKYPKRSPQNAACTSVLQK